MSFKFVMMPPQNDNTREWASQIGEAVPGAHVVTPEDDDAASRELADADAAFGTIPPDSLPPARKLRWLQAPAAAPPAGYYYQELVEHPVTITNFRGIFNDHLANHAMALVLALARNLPTYIAQQLRREWRPDRSDDSVVHLPEATALVLGVGNVGEEIARLCAAFGMRVLGVDARAESSEHAELHRPDELDELLPEADFVIMTIPHTPQTEGLMNRERFRAMKSSAFLVNIGRGMTVRLDDLVAALDGGEIRGAGLDVYEIEPLPADHPLWGAANVILTPHRADAGPYLHDRRTEILLDNARRFAAGEPLRNVVDKASWY